MSNPHAFYLYDDSGSLLETVYPGDSGDMHTYASAVMLAVTISQSAQGRSVRIKGGNIKGSVVITASKEPRDG